MIDRKMYINSFFRFFSNRKRGSFHGLLFNLIFNHLIFLVKCQKLERTLLTGDHEEIALSAVGGDESGCKLACQLDEQCVGASIGGRGQKCLQFKEGYGIQTKGGGLRGWISYTCCRGRGCPRL